jgi:hypothetical protein
LLHVHIYGVIRFNFFLTLSDIWVGSTLYLQASQRKGNSLSLTLSPRWDEGTFVVAEV